MCYAIVEVRYRFPSRPEILRIADAETLNIRLHGLQNNEQVESITVYKSERVLRRQTMWASEKPSQSPST